MPLYYNGSNAVKAEERNPFSKKVEMIRWWLKLPPFASRG
jgi:hypothetical protein